MKLGFVVPGFSAHEGDWCIPVLLHLVRRLAREHDVHVFPLRYPHHRRSYEVCGASVHPQGGAAAAGVARFKVLQRGLVAVLAEHRRSAFDVLHGLWADEPGFVAVAAGRARGISTVVSLMGGELVALPAIEYGGRLSRFNRALTWASLRGAQRCTAGSDYLRRLARPHVPTGHLLHIPLGVETDLFSPGNTESSSLVLRGGPKLLHAASLVPVKDQAMLLRAMAVVVSHVPSARLHVVGDGPLRDQLQHQAQSLGIAGNVTFHGAVSHDRMPAYYRAADLFVLASRHEGQELVTLEAAACGRGGIGTAVGVMPDLSPGTRTVPVGDAFGLADSLIDALSAPDAVAEMGQHARAAVDARYSLTHTIEALLATYASLWGTYDGLP
jgi:glycosyltransferase involved in cell wall biosynthesis